MRFSFLATATNCDHDGDALGKKSRKYKYIICSQDVIKSINIYRSYPNKFNF